MSSTASRSLAEDLRHRSAEELTQLLLLRPDLAHPLPADVTALAARAATSASVARALDMLNAGQVLILEAIVWVGAPDASLATVAQLLDLAADEVAVAAGQLRERALLWGDEQSPQPVRAVAELLRREWGDDRPAPIQEPAQLRSVARQAPPAARAILERLLAGPSVAVIDDGPGARTAREGADWLASCGLCVRTDDGQLALPRPVALALTASRSGHAIAPPPLPGASTSTSTEGNVDRLAAARANDLVENLGELLEAVADLSPRVLRDGGIAVRDVSHLARVASTSESDIGLLLELAAEAGLLVATEDSEPTWIVPAAADRWRQRTRGHQWAAAAHGWLTSRRGPHLTPSPYASERPLGPARRTGLVASLRADLLDILASVDPGQRITADQALDQLRWRRPRRLPTDPLAWVVGLLNEAERLGVTAGGELSSMGQVAAQLVSRSQTPSSGPPDQRNQVDTSDPAVAIEALATTLDSHLPSPVDSLIVQADMTIIAAGPLTAHAHAAARAVATVESRGGATVFRISAQAIRRSLDAGARADTLIGALRQRAATTLPQNVEYLIKDTARQHGSTKVGAARAYLQCEDPAMLEQLTVDPALASLRLRSLAPTVAISPEGPDIVWATLRDSGIAAHLEAADQGIVRVRPQRSRAPDEDLVTTVFDRAAAAAAARALLDGQQRAASAEQQAATASRPRLTSCDPTEALVALSDAAASGDELWVSHVGDTGTIERFVFRPQRVTGGLVSGMTAGKPRTLSIHRVRAVGHPKQPL